MMERQLTAKIREINSSPFLKTRQAENFFGVIQPLYNFIAGNSKRHDVFLEMQRGEVT